MEGDEGEDGERKRAGRREGGKSYREGNCRAKSDESAQGDRHKDAFMELMV